MKSKKITESIKSIQISSTCLNRILFLDPSVSHNGYAVYHVECGAPGKWTFFPVEIGVIKTKPEWTYEEKIHYIMDVVQGIVKRLFIRGVMLEKPSRTVYQNENQDKKKVITFDSAASRAQSIFLLYGLCYYILGRFDSMEFKNVGHFLPAHWQPAMKKEVKLNHFAVELNRLENVKAMSILAANSYGKELCNNPDVPLQYQQYAMTQFPLERSTDHHVADAVNMGRQYIRRHILEEKLALANSANKRKLS